MNHTNWSLGTFNWYFPRRGSQYCIVLVNFPLLRQILRFTYRREDSFQLQFQRFQSMIVLPVSLSLWPHSTWEQEYMIPEKVCLCKSRQKAKIGIKEVLKSQCTLPQPSSFDLTFSYEIFILKDIAHVGMERAKWGRN